MLFTPCLYYFAERDHLDVGFGSDLANQILRHAQTQAFSAHHHLDFSSVVGEKHGRLASRVAAAYDENLLAVNAPCLRPRSPIQHSAAQQTLAALRLQTPPLDSRGQQHSSRKYLITTVQLQLVPAISRSKLSDAARHGDLSPETYCLLHGASSQVFAG